jgi:hypothetical protein
VVDACIFGGMNLNAVKYNMSSVMDDGRRKKNHELERRGEKPLPQLWTI